MKGSERFLENLDTFLYNNDIFSSTSINVLLPLYIFLISFNHS